MRALLPHCCVRADVDGYLRGRRYIHARTRRRDKRDGKPGCRETPSGGGRRATRIVEIELDAGGCIHVAAVHPDRNGEGGIKREAERTGSGHRTAVYRRIRSKGKC